MRVCGLVLAVVAAQLVVAPAFASTVFVRANVITVNGGTNPWFESKEATGIGLLSLDSVHGPLSAAVVAGSSPGTWQVFAKATVEGNAQHRGSVADALVSVTVTDRVTPTVSAGIQARFISYVQTFFIEGRITGENEAPANYRGTAFFEVQHDSQTVVRHSETVSNTHGYTETMPRGTIGWTTIAEPGVPFDFRMDIEAYAATDTDEDAGYATISVNFGNTFVWGSVTDVRNAETGALIDASDFHLYGEDGFDWAHPPTVPEPATPSLLAPLALCLSRRRSSGGPRKRDSQFSPPLI